MRTLHAAGRSSALCLTHGKLVSMTARFGKTVRRTAVVPMPKNLIREGRIVSTETMGELIRRTMRENGIRCSQAAIVLPNETVFIRNVTTPLMTIDQLNYNLPFEFRDYITDELKDYLFDYAVVSITDPNTAEISCSIARLKAFTDSVPSALSS